MHFDVIDQQLIRYSAFFDIGKKWEYNGTLYQLYIEFEKAYGSVKREVLCNILIEYDILMKLAG
jgi:hypothetical protein